MSRENQAIITVRYYVGEDRERSLVKLYKKIDENLDIVPPGVTGWVVKPVEIDDVPMVTLTLAQSTLSDDDDMTLRRVAEEVDAAAGRRQGRVAGVCRGRAAAGGAGADGPGPDGGLSRLAAGIAAGHPGGQRAADGRRFPQQRPADPRRGRRALQRRPAIARSGRRRVRRPAGVPQGRGPRRGRAGGSRQLRAPRLGAGPRVHRARVLSRHRAGRGARGCGRVRRVENSRSNDSSSSDLAAGRDHRHRQEERLQRRLGGQCRAARGREAARDDRARRHGTGRHPQLRPDRQREGQRTGRGAWPWPS